MTWFSTVQPGKTMTDLKAIEDLKTDIEKFNTYPEQKGDYTPEVIEPVVI